MKTLSHACIGAALLALAAPAHAQTQTFPTKPVRFVVPFAAGSATDTMGRSYGQKMSEFLGQPVVIDNKPGANGMIGADSVAKAPADGYTLMVGTNSTNAANKSLFKKLPYDQEKDFAPVAFLGSVPLIVGVNNDFPAKTLAEFIALGKAKPGYITFATASASQRVASEMLAGMAGIKMVHVPYKSGPTAMTDMLSGQVMMFTADFAVMLPQVKAGKVRGLAVTSTTRSSVIPELPTVAEAGNLKGYELIAWFGVFAPAGTPRDVIAKLNAAANKAGESAEVKTRLSTLGVEIVPASPEWLAGFAQSETAKWAKAVKDAGIEQE